MNYKICKYYHSKLEAISKYIECLYDLPGCAVGGLLHIVVDDNNYDDDSIIFCYNECCSNLDRIESKLGILICMELLTLPMESRRLLYRLGLDYEPIMDRCSDLYECENCPICTGISKLDQ